MKDKVLFCYSCQCDTMHEYDSDQLYSFTCHYNVGFWTCKECHTRRSLKNEPETSTVAETTYAIVIGAIAASIVIGVWMSYAIF